MFHKKIVDSPVIQLIMFNMKKETAIKLAGSQVSLARLLGISQAAVCVWKEDIPQARVWQLKVLKPEWFKV